MLYNCMYPDCTYAVTDREKIDWHHIKPKELGGSDMPSNRMYLCPTHHRHIFVTAAKNGIHSMKSKSSIVIHGFIQSTAGIVLHYTDCEDDTEYYYMYSKKLKAPAHHL